MTNSKHDNSHELDVVGTNNKHDDHLSKHNVPGLVSVVIPTYNRAGLVGRAIESVQSQTYKNLEIIVVDDASTDDTESILMVFADKRIHYIRHEQNKGGGAARNTGIEAAMGEYIAFLDSDDEWLPSKLAEQLIVFDKASDKLGVVYCGAYFVDSHTQETTEEIVPDYRGNVLGIILNRGSGPSLPAAVVRRECFYKIGLFDERFPSYQDTDLWIRIAQYYEFDFVKEPLLKVSRNHKQISTDEHARRAGRELFLAKYSHLLPRLTKCKLYYMIGNAYCLEGNIGCGRKNMLKSIITYPFFFKSYTCLFISLFGSCVYRWIRQRKRELLTT